MTADLINLRRVRKARARQQAALTAADNRVAFGRSKGEKRETAMLRAQSEQRLDAHRLAGTSREDDDGAQG